MGQNTSLYVKHFDGIRKAPQHHTTEVQIVYALKLIFKHRSITEMVTVLVSDSIARTLRNFVTGQNTKKKMYILYITVNCKL